MKLFEILARQLKQKVQFSNISEESAVFQSMLNKLEQAGFQRESIIDFCREDMEGLIKSHEAAPKLLNTMYENRWESSLFSFLQKNDPTDLARKIGAPVFKRIWMQKLLTAMASIPGGEFFPLRSVVDPKAQRHPMFEYSEDNPEYESITTAAAFLDGRYVFNEAFMQSLINFAFLKDTQPTSRYFKCNGGNIPDEYCYAEFVIAHELLHYTNSDFHVQHKINKPNHKVINWATDFRSNYILVKSGFSQLPMGLFSDEFNFDKYRDISKLYHDVLEEYNKLPKEDNKYNSNKKGEPGDGDGDTILDKYGSDDHEPGTKAAQSEAEQKKADKASESDFNNHAEQQDDKLEKAKESSSGESESEINDNPKSNGNSSPGRGLGSPQTLDIDDVKPVFTWQRILKNMIASVKPKIDSSWAKMHKRSITTVVSANTTGSGAIKPGIVKGEVPEINIVLAIDSSGSMSSVINTIMSESFNLIRKNFSQADFYIMLWSSDSHLYRCNLSKNSATLISGINDRNGSLTVPLKQILTTYKAGGTDFVTVAPKLVELMQKNYNVVLITDTDIGYGDNLSSLIQLAAKYGSLINVILDSNSSFVQVTNLLSGSRLKNITHF